MEHDLYCADQLTVLVFEIEHADMRTKCCEHIEQSSARRVESQPIEDQVRAGKESGSAKEEGSRRDISRNHGLDGLQLLSTCDADRVRRAVDMRAKGTQRQFAMVAGTDGFPRGRRAFRLQSGEEQGSLHLRAGNRRSVVDACKLAAPNRDRSMAFRERNLGAH